ncbi:probable Cl- channel CLC-3 and related proteins (CLC superfamily) [Cephalotrichum gorgonifer]|uniref:Chloride channel protein n=1 Tax=Cephalotrichum gorgonifer TaxID=2041049 RepID=A0AAE8SUX4_9PEZI|nr:probable Cl- channel CLC-3 and related proteins (CLC superfamily) [Cephalotrichum gorgonifer]
MGTDNGDSPKATEATPLLLPPSRRSSHNLPTHPRDPDVGERLPYNDYATVDWLHDLVDDSVRRAKVNTRSRPSIRIRLAAWWDSTQGWIAAFAIGILTAAVAFLVDVSVATVADLKEGRCEGRWWLDRRSCCALDDTCERWTPWTETFGAGYAIYVASALLFGLISSGLTLTTKASLPAESGSCDAGKIQDGAAATAGKTIYLAAGSGIPEIKTVLSGFVIPHIFDFKVLVVKAAGAVFAVATGMCLGKEGPFVHISTCVGYLVCRLIPKYASNPRKMREMLSVACSAGLSVAFGAPIGGVLFSYEEISTYFPRQVLWRSFLCSLVAAAALKEFNPAGTGKLVLFETNYGVDYDVTHYLVFIFLGLCGGVFGGVFCNANFRWTKSFRQIPAIKKSPVLEVAIVVLATALLQYPNRLIRQPGDIVMERLLVDCKHISEDWICEQEALVDGKGTYYAWLISGTLVKLILTTITFGCKVPSGVIIPALDAGALFGRMVGQLIPDISSGIFAMVGAAAFLAGVSRMTVSLAVIMFELTGEVNFIPPFMVAILTAKWVADCINADGVYDLSQHLMGHPFLDSDQALRMARKLRDSEGDATVMALVPPAKTMEEITVSVGPGSRVAISTLRKKLDCLRDRGLMDAGLVIVNERGICQGYIAEEDLELALQSIHEVEQQGEANEVSLQYGVFSSVIDRSPMSIPLNAPLEYAVEMFGKLGLRYLIIVEEDTARMAGVIIKKRLLSFLDALRE